MFSRTSKLSLWFFGNRKFPLTVSSLNIITTQRMHSTQGKEDPKGTTPKNVFVQVLPVIPAPATHATEHSGALVSLKTTGADVDGKILLCKWASGAFKDRYTGLIKPLSPQEQTNIQNLSIVSQKHKILLQIAEAIIPTQLRSRYIIEDLELVGLLTFDDPPACDEYIYRANLTEAEAVVPGNESIDSNQNQVIPFGEHTCYWYNWNQIPFKEMPDDDALWYPKVLWEGQKVKGTFIFGSWSEKTIKSY